MSFKPIDSETYAYSINHLKGSVTISLFDGCDKGSYIISNDNRNWKVDKIVSYIYHYINGINSIQDIHDLMKKEHCIVMDCGKISQIIDDFFVKNGLLVNTTSTTKQKKNKMLWGRITIIPSYIVEKITFLTFLFNKSVMKVLLTILTFFVLYIAISTPSILTYNFLVNINFNDTLLIFILVVLLTLIHEIGHSTAAMSYGVNPGRIGGAIYFVMPVFFSDVSNIWKLGKNERIVVDLAGIYFQALCTFVLWIINLSIFKNEIINVAIIISVIQVIANFNPFIRFDGYWVLTDWLGIINLKNAVLDIWSSFFKKVFLRKKIEHKYSSKIRNVFMCYSMMFIFFALYFIRYIFITYYYGVKEVVHDINNFLISGRSFSDISIFDVGKFISLHFIVIIYSFFIAKIVIMIMKVFVNLFVAIKNKVIKTI